MSGHADFIKETHKILRTTVKLKGEKLAKSVWKKHLQNQKHLQKYAKSMLQLATEEWDSKKDLKSRLHWIHDEIIDYFYNGKALDKYEKEQRKASYSKAEKIDQYKAKAPTERVSVLDVGSCYNPFSKFEKLKVTPIDISPASSDVYRCDFLALDILNQTNSNKETDEKGEESVGNKAELTKLPESSFEAVVFSFLLEYLPSPKMRLECCVKAFKLLEPGGILCIATPDSKSQNSHAQFFKFWKVSLLFLGFQRIKYEKYEHFHGMIFRKGIYPDLWHIDATKEYDNIKEKTIKEKFQTISLEDTKTSLFIIQDFNS